MLTNGVRCQDAWVCVRCDSSVRANLQSLSSGGGGDGGDE